MRSVTSPLRVQEVVLDQRRRTSLAKVGRRDDTKYLAEEYEDGTIVLVPATTVSKIELAALGDPELADLLRSAKDVDPSTLRRRGSFAEFAGD